MIVDKTAVTSYEIFKRFFDKMLKYVIDEVTRLFLFSVMTLTASFGHKISLISEKKNSHLL